VPRTGIAGAWRLYFKTEMNCFGNQSLVGLPRHMLTIHGFFMICRRFINIFFIIFFIHSCGLRGPKQPQENILVNIDNKATISVEEFIQRAEYTPRPAFCKGNTYIQKKVILNSLIAEKLLALEAGDKSPLFKNDEFLGFLKGRREQAMRQWMHHVEATDKVKLDTTEIKRAYARAGREVDVEYYAISDSNIINKFGDLLTSDPRCFDELYKQVAGDTSIPTRKVTWNAPENVHVHDALFSADLSINQVLKPVKLDENDYLIIRVKGWSDDLAMTEKQRQERLDKVNEKLTSINASIIWQSKVADIMKGKKLEFNKDTFDKVDKLFFKLYFKSPEQQQDELVDQLWGHKEQDMAQLLSDTYDADLIKRPFFTVDGKSWTVDDFRRELISHPLVYRKQKMSSKEFPGQLRLAVADLIRDHFVTQEAYKKGYDKINVVQREVDMWRDTFTALFQKQKYLQSIGENRNFAKHYMEIVNERLNPYVNELQKKYYKKIIMDFDQFEKIGLTSIDLYVKQPSQPFQDVVPLFPVITTDNLIEYIAKMEPTSKK
jgi:hypothetical protein